jgi:hypothetical protein
LCTRKVLVKLSASWTSYTGPQPHSLSSLSQTWGRCYEWIWAVIIGKKLIWSNWSLAFMAFHGLNVPYKKTIVHNSYINLHF